MLRRGQATANQRWGNEAKHAEQMKLYQEMGINPFGSCLPTLIQFPIIIGLYQAVISAMAATPLQLITFSHRIYDAIPNLAGMLPLNNHFLWMDLSQPERLFPFSRIKFDVPPVWGEYE